MPTTATMYVFATKAGAPSNPDWYYNLTALGEGVELGTESYPVTVSEVQGEERDRIYEEQAPLPGLRRVRREDRGHPHDPGAGTHSRVTAEGLAGTDTSAASRRSARWSRQDDPGGVPRVAAAHAADHLRRAVRRAADGARRAAVEPVPARTGPPPDRRWSASGSASARPASRSVRCDDPGAGKDADFDGGSVASVVADFAAYDEECRLADAAVARSYQFDHTFSLNDEDFSLRLAYAHLVVEYSRHNGHGDQLRERIDGTTGS